MRVNLFLLSLMSMASVGLRAETIPLCDFEDQKPLNGVWWGVTETVVPNPLPSINTSSYCSKMVISGYGIDGFKNTSDLSKFCHGCQRRLYGAECAGVGD